MRTKLPTACAELRLRQTCARAALALVLGALASGCVRFTYRSVERFRPPDPAAVGELATGATMTDCLEQLGAPWQVLEQEEQRGLVLIYAWAESGGWVGSVSSGQKNVPGSLTVGRGAAGWSTLQLWFDTADRLERWELGALTPELAAGLTRQFGTDFE